MSEPLSPVAIRVLGSLAEKALATPDYYPMSLNALVAACNQKTGRDPVMDLGEDEVAAELDHLMRRRLAGTTSGAGSRVDKYRHLLDHSLEVNEAELAVLAVLMLRGPQTAGEIRARTGRMHEFDSIEDVETALSRMAEREEPLVVTLPLQPGRKEPRLMHLLGGEVDLEALSNPPSSSPDSQLLQRVEDLEAAIEALRGEFESFRQQFE